MAYWMTRWLAGPGLVWLCCAPLAAAWFAPSSLAYHADLIYVAGERSGEVLALLADEGRELWRVKVGDDATGLALDPTGTSIFVCTTQPEDRVLVLDARTGRRIASYPAGRGVCSPVAGTNALYVCHRFDHTVGVYDRRTGIRRAQIPVLREPTAAALSPDQLTLVVANLLPSGPANRNDVAASLSLLDTTRLTARKEVRLPTGSTAVRGTAIDPSGRWCAVAHSLGRYPVPTTQAEHGWMSVSVLSLLDLQAESLKGAVVLDEPRNGAANPWGVAWAGKYLYVTHSGTHEFSRIEVDALLARLTEAGTGGVVNDLEFLKGIRERVSVPGQGSRTLVVGDARVYLGQFFTDTLEVFDRARNTHQASWSLATERSPDLERLGEEHFHDATLGHQGWQSCATCHPDGRADGLNWDLLNDGLGNPKNTKSLVLSHRTPPAMSLGVRASAEKAVRSGFRHILFTPPNETTALAVDAYLKGLRAVPALQRPPESVRRGQRLFESAQVGCAVCHPSPLYTDQARHRVGTDSKRDRLGAGYDTPTLIECWRTAPYLHDGSAATLREVLTTRNSDDQHGKTSHLTTDQLDDLEAFVLSLPDR